ncbi:MAG: hypothetical protein ACE5J4_02420 [Candidatus Aenigmatarchaeota archaeon]
MSKEKDVANKIVEEVRSGFEDIKRALEKLNGNYDASLVSHIDTRLMTDGAALLRAARYLSGDPVYEETIGEHRKYEARLISIKSNHKNKITSK